MDPSHNEPYRYLAPVAEPFQPGPLTVVAAASEGDTSSLSDDEAPSTELAVEAAAPETPVAEIIPPAPAVPQYPIGLIDFNLPIVVLDNADYNDEEYDNPSIVTVLKGSVHPVVVSFWKHGEQCIAQFDTDGDSSCGDYKVEQDQPYPRTVYVVVGRDGRNLVLDGDLYLSAEAAQAETSLDEVAGIFPLVVQAPVKPEPVLPTQEAPELVGHDDGIEGEEDENEVEGIAPVSTNVTNITEPPTEMYVAGRMRRVGETVSAYRTNFGTRTCTILKMRRDSRKSLFIDPRDGNEPYWALNKNIRTY
jgi:hypothetical protein